MSEMAHPSRAHSGHHIVPVPVYLLIFTALLVGTALTVWVSFHDLDVQLLGKIIPFNTVVMLAIAATKAMLVILFFMHVKYSPRLLWIFVAAGFMWLAILIILTMADYASRNW
jgi:cytochrome c oxidase subunit 4